MIYQDFSAHSSFYVMLRFVRCLCFFEKQKDPAIYDGKDVFERKMMCQIFEFLFQVEKGNIRIYIAGVALIEEEPGRNLPGYSLLNRARESLRWGQQTFTHVLDCIT
jgi:hypothetical protein